MTTYKFNLDDNAVAELEETAKTHNTSIGKLFGEALAVCVEARRLNGKTAIIDEEGNIHFVEFKELTTE